MTRWYDREVIRRALPCCLLLLLLLPAVARAVDTDGDGVQDDVDNCPLTYNPTQEDRGGLASTTADGAGDACQNGDWNQDGRVDALDTTLVRRALAGFPPQFDPHQPPVPAACPVGFCDSDGVAANGCEDPLDDNVQCADSGSLGTVNGDASGSSFSITGRGEIFGNALVLESSSAVQDLRARITLQPPADANYDLYVTCNTCAGTPIASTNPGSAAETIDVGALDHTGNQSFAITIEVRWIGGTGCGSWTLDVQGDTGSGTNVCE